MGLGPPELIIILIVVLVLFGSTKIPKLARSLGQAQREFKKGTDSDVDDDDLDEDVAPPVDPVAKRPKRKA